MPGVQELEPTEFNDFTGGLWERGTDRECPKNGLLELKDAYPQPRGGLRAFLRFVPVSQSGLPSDSLFLGIWKLRPPDPQGRLHVATLTLNAGGAGLHTFAVYSMQVSSLSEVQTGTWSQDLAIQNVSVIDTSIQMVSYRTDALGYRKYINAPVALGATSTDLSTMGIWRFGSTVTSSTATSAVATNNPAIPSTRYPDAMVTHQARLLYTELFSQLHNRIVYTNQGADSTSTNFVDPLGEKSGGITWMDVSPPSNLVLAKNEVGVILTQGDMLNPQMRQMSFSHNAYGSFPCPTEFGTVFMVPGDGMYAFGPGGGVQHISPQIYGSPMNPGFYPGTFSIANSDAIKVSQPTLSGNFLFAGKGYVMDVRSNAWFRSSYCEVLAGAKNFTTDPTFFRTYFTTNDIFDGNKQMIWSGYFIEDADATVSTWNPAPSYSFTLPLMYNPGQQTIVREVEYHVDVFVPHSKITIETITPKETKSQSHELSSVGPQKIRVQTAANDEWIKVRTTLEAPAQRGGPNEAPYLERLFVYTQKGTRFGVG